MTQEASGLFKSTSTVVVTVAIQTIVLAYFLGTQVTELKNLKITVESLKNEWHAKQNLLYTKGEVDVMFLARDNLLRDIKERLARIEDAKK